MCGKSGMSSIDILMVCAAFFGSILAGLFGGGAGLIFTPTIYLFLSHVYPNAEHIMQTSITTMIAALIPSGIVASVQHHRYAHIDWSVFKWSAPLICMGAVVGCFLMTFISSHNMMLIFSVVTLILAIRATLKLIQKHQQHAVGRTSLTLKYVGSVILGIVSTISGAASFIVPYFEKVGLSLKESIGTTTIVVLCYSLIVLGFMIQLGLNATHLPDGNIGFLNYHYLWMLILPTFPGVLVGTKLAKLLPERKLKILFTVLLYCIGMSMFAKAM